MDFPLNHILAEILWCRFVHLHFPLISTDMFSFAKNFDYRICKHFNSESYHSVKHKRYTQKVQLDTSISYKHNNTKRILKF